MRRQEGAALKLYAELASGARDAGLRSLEALAHHRQGLVHRRGGDIEAATAAFERAIATGDYERGALASLHIAEMTLDAAPERALARMEALCWRWPDSVAADTAVKILAQRRSPERVGPWLERLADERREHKVADNALFMRGWVALFREGDIGLARRTFRAVVTRWPRGPLIDDAMWTLGAILRRQGAWVEAAQVYGAMLDNREGQGFWVGSYRHPKLDQGAWMAGAILFHALGDCEGAAAAWRRALEMFDSSIIRDDCWWGLALCSAQAGDADGARELLRRLLDERPDSRYAPIANEVVAGAPVARLPGRDPAKVRSPLWALDVEALW